MSSVPRGVSSSSSSSSATHAPAAAADAPGAGLFAAGVGVVSAGADAAPPAGAAVAVGGAGNNLSPDAVQVFVCLAVLRGQNVMFDSVFGSFFCTLCGMTGTGNFFINAEQVTTHFRNCHTDQVLADERPSRPLLECVLRCWATWAPQYQLVRPEDLRSFPANATGRRDDVQAAVQDALCGRRPMLSVLSTRAVSKTVLVQAGVQDASTRNLVLQSFGRNTVLMDGDVVDGTPSGEFRRRIENAWAAYQNGGVLSAHMGAAAARAAAAVDCDQVEGYIRVGLLQGSSDGGGNQGDRRRQWPAWAGLFNGDEWVTSPGGTPAASTRRETAAHAGSSERVQKARAQVAAMLEVCVSSALEKSGTVRTQRLAALLVPATQKPEDVPRLRDVSRQTYKSYCAVVAGALMCCRRPAVAAGASIGAAEFLAALLHVDSQGTTFIESFLRWNSVQQYPFMRLKKVNNVRANTSALKFCIKALVVVCAEGNKESVCMRGTQRQAWHYLCVMAASCKAAERVSSVDTAFCEVGNSGGRVVRCGDQVVHVGVLSVAHERLLVDIGQCCAKVVPAAAALGADSVDAEAAGAAAAAAVATAVQRIEAAHAQATGRGPEGDGQLWLRHSKQLSELCRLALRLLCVDTIGLSRITDAAHQEFTPASFKVLTHALRRHTDDDEEDDNDDERRFDLLQLVWLHRRSRKSSTTSWEVLSAPASAVLRLWAALQPVAAMLHSIGGVGGMVPDPASVSRYLFAPLCDAGGVITEREYDRCRGDLEERLTDANRRLIGATPRCAALLSGGGNAEDSTTMVRWSLARQFTAYAQRHLIPARLSAVVDLVRAAPIAQRTHAADQCADMLAAHPSLKLLYHTHVMPHFVRGALHTHGTVVRNYGADSFNGGDMSTPGDETKREYSRVWYEEMLTSQRWWRRRPTSGVAPPPPVTSGAGGQFAGGGTAVQATRTKHGTGGTAIGGTAALAAMTTPGADIAPAAAGAPPPPPPPPPPLAPSPAGVAPAPAWLGTTETAVAFNEAAASTLQRTGLMLPEFWLRTTQSILRWQQYRPAVEVLVRRTIELLGAGDGNGRLMVQLPVGSGKSLALAALTKALSTVVLFVQPTSALCTDFVRSVREHGVCGEAEVAHAGEPPAGDAAAARVTLLAIGWEALADEQRNHVDAWRRALARCKRVLSLVVIDEASSLLDEGMGDEKFRGAAAGQVGAQVRRLQVPVVSLSADVPRGRVPALAERLGFDVSSASLDMVTCMTYADLLRPRQQVSVRELLCEPGNHLDYCVAAISWVGRHTPPTERRVLFVPRRDDVALCVAVAQSQPLAAHAGLTGGVLSYVAGDSAQALQHFQERAALQGQPCPLLVCTNILAAGMNLPIDHVLVAPYARGPDVLNAAGRAGRCNNDQVCKLTVLAAGLTAAPRSRQAGDARGPWWALGADIPRCAREFIAEAMDGGCGRDAVTFTRCRPLGTAEPCSYCSSSSSSKSGGAGGTVAAVPMTAPAPPPVPASPEAYSSVDHVSASPGVSSLSPTMSPFTPSPPAPKRAAGFKRVWDGGASPSSSASLCVGLSQRLSEVLHRIREVSGGDNQEWCIACALAAGTLERKCTKASLCPTASEHGRCTRCGGRWPHATGPRNDDCVFQAGVLAGNSYGNQLYFEPCCQRFAAKCGFAGQRGVPGGCVLAAYTGAKVPSDRRMKPIAVARWVFSSGGAGDTPAFSESQVALFESVRRKSMAGVECAAALKDASSVAGSDDATTLAYWLQPVSTNRADQSAGGIAGTFARCWLVYVALLEVLLEQRTRLG